MADKLPSCPLEHSIPAIGLYCNVRGNIRYRRSSLRSRRFQCVHGVHRVYRFGARCAQHQGDLGATRTGHSRRVRGAGDVHRRHRPPLHAALSRPRLRMNMVQPRPAISSLGERFWRELLQKSTALPGQRSIARRMRMTEQ